MLKASLFPGNGTLDIHKAKRLSVVAKAFIDFMYQQGPSLLPENVDHALADTNLD